jgi:hypothetical protein
MSRSGQFWVSDALKAGTAPLGAEVTRMGRSNSLEMPVA